MKYSVSSWIYGEEDIEKTMRRIHECGYDAIELHGEPGQRDAAQIRELAEKYSLKISSLLGSYPWPTDERDLSSKNPDVRKKAVDYVNERLEFAKEIGAPLFVVIPVPFIRPTPQAPLEQEWAWAVESLKAASQQAKELGVFIAIEPINRYESYLCSTCTQALRMAEAVGSKWVKIMLDTYHMNIEEADPSEAIRRAGDNLIHLHVSDSNRLSVGRGHIDFVSIMRALKEINYRHYLTMEMHFLPLSPHIYFPITGIKEEEFKRRSSECINLLKILEEVV